MKKTTILSLALICVVSSIVAAYIFSKSFSKEKLHLESDYTSDNQSVTVSYTGSDLSDLSFVEASKRSINSVVFIKTESEVVRRSPFWFFDMDPFGSIGKVSSTGSGVIISEDGYIITNYHVIKGASKIEIVLNNQKKNFTAEVVGTAPSTDLALLKISATNLTAIEITNSDVLSVGEWVLAVGNPFNLTSTVTAGIVSAKGRNINIVDNQFPIESFIQTDAAINPGNSGGALVNLEGKLVGINTAIASKTGSYVGYGFAIPSNIVVKIINDLKEYGQIQRGIDGLEVTDISEEISAKFNDLYDGVYIAGINATNKSSTDKLKVGDIIISVDGKEVANKSAYDEQLAYHRPGDKLVYMILRNGEKIAKDITLVNMDGDFELKARITKTSETLGGEFEMISKLEQNLYNIGNGVRVVTISQGQLAKMNISEGFIFLSINNSPIKDLDDFMNKMENLKGQVRIEGISPQGGRQNLSYFFR
ncbi:MAG: serine protease Do [Bacteroidia bacterium]|jgi:serine protease Do